MGESAEVRIHGFVSPGYEPVKELFEKNFKRGLEANAQLCAYVGEEKVVDIWGSATNDKSFDGDSLSMIFSSTKSLTSIVFASLVDQGLIAYEGKVSSVWPDFAKNGKGDITFDSILRHEAGLSKMRTDVDSTAMLPENIKRNSLGPCVEDAIPRKPTSHPSGTDRAYHALSRGVILNEIFRRVDPKKRTIGQVLREEVAGPLQADVYIGLRPEEESRVTKLESWPIWYVYFQQLLPDMMSSKIERSTLGYLGGVYKAYKISRPRPSFPWDGKNKTLSLADFSIWAFEWARRGEIPSSNGHCSARGLARVAAVMANGGRLGDFQLLKPATWEAMHGGATKKVDVAQNIPGLSPTIFTRGGLAFFDVYDDEPESLQQIRSLRQGYYGWYGLGGSVFQWHPEYRIGFAYVPTLMAWYDPLNMRGARLQRAVLDCTIRKKQEAATET